MRQLNSSIHQLNLLINIYLSIRLLNPLIHQLDDLIRKLLPLILRFSPTERFRGKLSCVVEFPLNGLDMSAYASSRTQQPVYNLYAVSNHSGTLYNCYTAYVE